MPETQLFDQYLYQSPLKSDPKIKVSSGKRVPFVIDLNQVKDLLRFVMPTLCYHTRYR
ncbi:hypothetical protein Plhal703r1_c22g0096181 [Plasmopara halstedii]